LGHHPSAFGQLFVASRRRLSVLSVRFLTVYPVPFARSRPRLKVEHRVHSSPGRCFERSTRSPFRALPGYCLSHLLSIPPASLALSIPPHVLPLVGCCSLYPEPLPTPWNSRAHTTQRHGTPSTSPPPLICLYPFRMLPSGEPTRPARLLVSLPAPPDPGVRALAQQQASTLGWSFTVQQQRRQQQQQDARKYLHTHTHPSLAAPLPLACPHRVRFLSCAYSNHPRLPQIPT
jgi:hypothetical protein